MTIIAQAAPFDIALLIPISAIFIGGLIAVSSIMARHQRKMAALMRENPQQVQPEVLDELRQMRQEVQALRSELHQTTIAVDDIRKELPATRLEQRVSEEN